METRIGFWNVQRVGDPENVGPAGERAGLVTGSLSRWGLDLFVLAEVSQKGDRLAAFLRGNLPDCTAQYVPVRDKNGNASACSFLVGFNNRKMTLVGEIETRGATSKRPMVTFVMRIAPSKRRGRSKSKLFSLEITGVHIIANRQKSADEVADVLNDLRGPLPSLVLGDMNLPFENKVPGINKEWQKLDPGLKASFQKDRRTRTSRALLDYAFQTGLNGNLRATPPDPGYNDWDTIDHAPIAFTLTGT